METLLPKLPKEILINGRIIKDDDDNPIGVAINDGSLDYATNEDRSKIITNLVANENK